MTDLMKNILKLNALFITIYLFALFLEKWLSFPFPLYLFGIIIFFLPGLNFSLTLEQITEKMGRAKIALWSFLFTLILTPAFIFYLPINPDRIAQEKETLLSFFLLLFISLGIFLFSYLINKKDSTLPKIPSFQKHSPFWIAIFIFILILGAHFLIYPFIPEADGYGYIQATEKTIETGKFFSIDNRSIFYAFIWTVYYLTQIPIYWIFKVIFPYLGMFLIIVSYKTSTVLNIPKKIAIPASLSFFLFPVILQSMLAFRPQMLFLLALPIAMFLLLDDIREKRLERIVLLLFLAAIGIKIHQTFVFLILGILPTIFYFAFQKYRAQGIAILSGLILVALLLLKKNLAELWAYFLYLTKHFNGFNFDIWFLDNYTSSYGEKMGWPGITFIYYYGYNFGLVFPALIVLAVWKRIKFPNLLKKYWPLILLLGVFLAFAEIFPRFGIIYEPNRFLLFSSVIISLFIPRLIKSFQEKISSKFFPISLAIIIVLTFALSLFLTYSKQGVATQAEYQASQFVQKNTPADSIFITQRGNGILVDFFYKRNSVYPSPQFFLENQPEKDRFILENLENIINYQNFLKAKDYLTENDKVFNFVYQKNSLEIPDNVKKTTNKRPIYILYSASKFQGIRGKRAWWQEMNFFGADLKKFNDAELYEKVYDEGGVLVWRYRK